MKVSMDYSDVIADLQTEVTKMLEAADGNYKKCLNEIGGVVATEVSRQAPRSDNDFYWSNGVKKSNTHIADDVTYKVGKAKRTKVPFVSVSGDKKTWPKWIVSSDGHVAQNGRFIPGNKFVEKAAKASEGKVDSIVDDFIRKVVK